jgi:hypothetical protein
MNKFILLSILIFVFASCIEINDDLKINSDGSGTFKYVINLSESKTKVNTILSLDSLDGKKVPSIEEIKEIIAEYKTKVSSKNGISNVVVESDFTNFILRFSCDFNDVMSLQKAIREIAIEKDKKQEYKEFNHIWLDFQGNKLVRSVPTLTTETIQKLKKEDSEALKNGKYTSVTRFDKEIERCENPKATISKNGTACMIKTNPYSLMKNLEILENTIYLSTIKR